VAFRMAPLVYTSAITNGQAFERERDYRIDDNYLGWFSTRDDNAVQHTLRIHKMDPSVLLA